MAACHFGNLRRPAEAGRPAPATTWYVRPALLLALLLSACTPPVGPAGVPGPAIVYVVDRGWHTDIGLPADEITGPLAGVARGSSGASFVTFGFGQRQFFMARQETSGAALRALLPSRSVLLMTTLRSSPAEAYGTQHVVSLRVSRPGIVRINAAISRQMQKTPDARPVALGAGPDPDSVFYAARGTYDAFDTCNTWTAALLHSGGLPVSSGGVVFAGQVMGMARALAAEQAEAIKGKRSSTRRISGCTMVAADGHYPGVAGDTFAAATGLRTIRSGLRNQAATTDHVHMQEISSYKRPCT